jgi:hypothetical protein
VRENRNRVTLGFNLNPNCLVSPSAAHTAALDDCSDVQTRLPCCVIAPTSQQLMGPAVGARRPAGCGVNPARGERFVCVGGVRFQRATCMGCRRGPEFRNHHLPPEHRCAIRHGLKYRHQRHHSDTYRMLCGSERRETRRKRETAHVA